MRIKALSAVAVIAVLTSVSVFAADDDAKTTGAAQKGATSQFDPRIDTWVEGTITALDADGQKFSIRGSKMPLATAHAGMQKDLHSKTENLNAQDRAAKENEVRKAWSDRLNNARAEKREEASDYNFALPAKGQLSVLDSGKVRDVAWLNENGPARGGEGAADRAERPIATTGDTDRDEARAMMTLKNLKVGDKVMVGYDSGIITNEAYVVVKQGGAQGNTGAATSTGAGAQQNAGQPAGQKQGTGAGAR